MLGKKNMSFEENKTAVIFKTINGRVYLCGHCNLIHCEFKNISLSMNKKELILFQEILNGIKPMVNGRLDMFAKEQKYSITLYHENCAMLVSKTELRELKELINNAVNSLDILKKGISCDCGLN